MQIEVVADDITRQRVDAIVNAANHSLLVGGGVCGAIHRAAGPELLAECRTLGGCPTGEARITRGYRLPARYVIHTVGPVWHGGLEGEPELLAACYRNSLRLAAEHELTSIAFPAISTGIFGYPLEAAARTAIDAVRGFHAATTLTLVRLVCFDFENRQIYERLLAA
jgi:O-acetyl-ADP-ribose deacetylase